MAKKKIVNSQLIKSIILEFLQKQDDTKLDERAIFNLIANAFASHPGGRSYPSWVNKDSILKEDSAEEQILQGWEELNEKIDLNAFPERLDVDDLSPIALMVLHSIYLFTGGSVSTLRDPSLYNPDKAEDQQLVAWGGGHVSSPQISDNNGNQTHKPLYQFKNPQKIHYENANKTLLFLASQPTDLKVIYRGIAIDFDENQSHLELFSSKIGSVIPAKPIASWTISRKVAVGFAREHKKLALLFVCKPPKVGLYVNPYSIYQNEQEVICSIQGIKIKDVEDGDSVFGKSAERSLIIHCEQVL